ncbi:hypothetical protein Nepgr_029394 [Nepenthes gracilis]|uniref:Uncharacterized protein n=1 Tax=Nepenthes gracilis TaxID=150966 RepID=A0AAD3TE34_NEPGR|nr:hypothetical protein Nepgr_029394 [Nepenthes gracilis]
MESYNQIYEDAGDFSSNESGWTKYIASPAPHEKNFGSGQEDADDDGGGHDAGRRRDDDDNDVDDDSVASDASSGPAHCVLPADVSGEGFAGGDVKRAADEGACRFYSGRKAYKEVKETSVMVVINHEERKESILKANRGNSNAVKRIVKGKKKNKRGAGGGGNVRSNEGYRRIGGGRFTAAEVGYDGNVAQYSFCSNKKYMQDLKTFAASTLSSFKLLRNLESRDDAIVGTATDNSETC